jgi:hypothetical protein
MSDRIARVFVDPNYRTNIEDSHGDFSIDLPLGVLVEAGSHLRVEGLVISHAWPTLDIRNCHIFIREVVAGVSYHRVVRLTDGNYNISTLAVELQEQLRFNSHITDGLWTVTSSEEGLLTISQSSATFDSARIYSASDAAGLTSVDSNSSWSQAWAAADVTVPLPQGGDAAALIGIPLRWLNFTPAASLRVTGHVNLARHRVLHLCTADLPQTSLSPHGRTDVVSSLIVAGNAPGSLIHNGFATPPSLYCANARQLRHMSFHVRDQADQLVDLAHAIHFELVVTRPYE